MTQSRYFIFNIISAYIIWGIFPVYFHFITVTPIIIIEARAILSLIFLSCVYTIQTRQSLITLFKQNRADLKKLLLASIFYLSNWWCFIHAVSIHHIKDLSLAYFISALMHVALGRIVLKEKIRSTQTAILIFTFCVTIFYAFVLHGDAITVLGASSSFSICTVLHKKIKTPAMHALLIESVFMLPIVLFAIAYSSTYQFSVLKTLPPMQYVLLSLAFTLTFPLLIFNKNMPFVPSHLIGILQYIAPTMKFLLAWLIFQEAILKVDLIVFVLIWIGILLYIFEKYWYNKKQSNIYPT